MKIRLVGSSDLVDSWCKELERAYSIKGSKYPCRNSSETRVYFDLDDRKAAEVVGLTVFSKSETVAAQRSIK